MNYIKFYRQKYTTYIIIIIIKYNKIILNFNIFSAVTVDGELCRIPFKYEKEGPDFNKCTTVGTSKGAWCATTVDDDMTYDAWVWC